MTTLPPQPDVDPDSQPYWDALNRGKLTMQYSPHAARWQFPPLERCRFTGKELVWKEVGGDGKIATFIIQHRGMTPGLDAELPYAIALVELDAAPGARLPARIVDSPLDKIKIGARVRCEIIDLPGGKFKMPVFRLA